MRPIWLALIPGWISAFEMTALAPGIDTERDILAHMDFKPIIGDVKPMDASVFR